MSQASPNAENTVYQKPVGLPSPLSLWEPKHGDIDKSIEISMT